MAVLMLATGTAAAFDAPYFGQAQGHLESFNGMPLISANWTGPYRPYVLENGRFVSLLPAAARESSRLDLYSPLPLSAHEILLAGSESGRAEYDVLKYDTETHTLVNLTATPAIDEGRLCVQRDARLVAFRMDAEERVAHVRQRLEALHHDRLPAFDHCTWIGPGELLGVASPANQPRLYRCAVAEDEVTCTLRPPLRDMDIFTTFLRGTPEGIDLIARNRKDLFRAPFRLPKPFAVPAPLPLARDIRGDVLDVDGNDVRWGFHSRYTSSLAPDSPATVYLTRRIGDAQFGIVATERTPRTLARAGPRGWELFRHPRSAAPEHAFPAREIWMRSATGELYQAFYFGPLAPERVVVWWHGGPHENVSPRFNPYFFRLNEFGFGVLAVNYPGSTGRGSGYERRFDERWLRDCLNAVWSYLRDNDVRVVVSWSVSTGMRMQALLLAQGLPISAIVDQSAWGPSTFIADTARRGIAFFAIRGRNDPRGPIERIDYAYPGGHDITSAEDFAGLFDAIQGFLRNAPVVQYEPDHDRIRLLIELPREGGVDRPPDAEEHALGFELATHLARDCFKPDEVAFSRNADVGISSPARDRDRVDRWLARHDKTPLATIHVRDGPLPAVPTPRDRRTIAIEAIDSRAPDDRAWLREETLTPEGILIRPRLRSRAREVCPRLRELIDDERPPNARKP